MTEFDELFYQESDSEPEPEFPFVDALGFHLRLANKHHSLWGELIWFAGRIVGNAIQTKKGGIDVTGKTVVEFGSGSGLCTLCAATSGARKVIATDYPDDLLIDNLIFNTKDYPNICVVGHRWGTDCSEILAKNDGSKCDITIMNDLVFNHSEHRHLLMSMTSVLKDDGYGIVAYTHHRPHLKDADNKFLTIAKEEFGLNVEELFTEKHEPMFPNDPGDLELRTTCHVYKLTFKHE